MKTWTVAPGANVRRRVEVDRRAAAGDGDRALDEHAVLRHVQRSRDGRLVERLADEQRDRRLSAGIPGPVGRCVRICGRPVSTVIRC